MKRPAFQFYPADWRKDPALSTCSLAARGLWIELMCVAHEAEVYGVLAINGKQMNIQQIARSVGESPALVSKLMSELEESNVFSRDESGCIFSRRMVKDEHIREVRANAGSLGGNPTLLKQKDKQKVKQGNKQILTPSSSSSSSENTPVVPDDLFERFYQSYPRHTAKQKAHEAWDKLKLIPDDSRIEAMRRGLAVAKQSRQWLEEKGRFVPHAATWLNGQRWTDEMPSANVIPIGGMEARSESQKVAL